MARISISNLNAAIAVIPAQAGPSLHPIISQQIPAFAGMTRAAGGMTFIYPYARNTKHAASMLAFPTSLRALLALCIVCVFLAIGILYFHVPGFLLEQAMDIYSWL